MAGGLINGASHFLGDESERLAGVNVDMGTFRASFGIGNPQGQRFESLDALVVTGATYTTLPGSLLRRLGVSSDRRVEFEPADGTIIQQDLGQT